MKLILHLELSVRWGRDRGRGREGLGWDAAPPHSALHVLDDLPGTRGNPASAERDSARPRFPDQAHDPTAASDVYAGAICGHRYRSQPAGWAVQCTEPVGHTKGGCLDEVT